MLRGEMAEIGRQAASSDRAEEWAARLKGRVGPETMVREREPLARRTTLRVGGPADVYVEPGSEEDLSQVLRFCAEEKVSWLLLGRGSNLLVKDKGFRGVVVCLSHSAFTRLEVEGQRLRCGAGVRLKQIAVEARRHGLSGLEFLEGIPGSLGGGLRMNAGAMGAWMFSVVESLRGMNRSGTVVEVPVADLPVSYRSCPWLESHIALSALLHGQRSTVEAVASMMKRYSARRWETQPAQSSAGCIFKNPAEIPAGKLIDELGLKGTRIGGAVVSEVHGNFIVNEGGATAEDMLALIDKIRSQARQRGIELQTEVQIVGE